MEDNKRGDLVLSQNTYAYIQDGTSGNVEIMNGPMKMSLSETDKTVNYDATQGMFVPCDRSRAVMPWIKATEGQYIELTNPTVGDNIHPTNKSKQSSPPLSIGKKINIPGPDTFALYPGQGARVINGHQLKSNEFLFVKVYNDKEAKASIKSAVVVTNPTEGETKNQVAGSSILEMFDPANLITGKILVIKGTDVSFFIPPTGMEVIPVGNGVYVRPAVTLEMLEYCILLDENGEKRFVIGPDVVFPQPTESFIEKEGTKKFRATELNDNMGIYVKVIADYKDEDGTEHEAGEELFITGKETKIYYPRAEHSLVEYDGQSARHYATTVPEGEARYILDKDTGVVDLRLGPEMLLPDPRKEVIIKRILSQRMVRLIYPGNEEAARYNAELEQITLESSPETLSRGFIASNSYSNSRGMGNAEYFGSPVAAAVSYQDSVQRKSTYTKPRTITLNTKYDGAPKIILWPGYAVQVIDNKGDRRIVEGPARLLLAYDETLEVLALSTGKPKSDSKLLETVYLQTTNNIVSDIVECETKDMVSLKIKISYRVNFEKENKDKWFIVPNYVKLLTQNCASILRNAIKKVPIAEFNENGVDIIRNIILGTSTEGTKRSGRKFEENGMHIYDVEVLGITIGDLEIDNLLKEVQRDSIANAIEKSLLDQKKELFLAKKQFKKEKATAKDKENEELTAFELSKIKREDAIRKETERIQTEEAEQNSAMEALRLESQIKREEADENHKAALASIEVDTVRQKMEAITPDIVGAIQNAANAVVLDTLAKNIKQSTTGLNSLLGGEKSLTEIIAGTPLAGLVEKAFSGATQK